MPTRSSATSCTSRSYAHARAATSGSLALAESANSLSTVIGAHLDLAAIECAAGRFDDAAAHIAAAEELNPETAHTWDDGVLIARADLALARGDNIPKPSNSPSRLQHSRMSRSAPALQGVANVRYLGDAQLAVGNAHDALTAYRQAIAKANRCARRLPPRRRTRGLCGCCHRPRQHRRGTRAPQSCQGDPSTHTLRAPPPACRRPVSRHPRSRILHKRHLGAPSRQRGVACARPRTRAHRAREHPQNDPVSTSRRRGAATP